MIDRDKQNTKIKLLRKIINIQNHPAPKLDKYGMPINPPRQGVWHSEYPNRVSIWYCATGKKHNKIMQEMEIEDFVFSGVILGELIYRVTPKGEAWLLRREEIERILAQDSPWPKEEVQP